MFANRRAACRLILMVTLASPLCIAQEDQAPTDSGSPPAMKSLEGLWPSEKLTNLLLQRWADEIGHRYDISETERASLSDAVVKRWAPFLAENRAKIQPLVNEFIEMRLDLQPPSKEHVREWAERALPVLDKFREQISEAADDVRGFLGPLQRAKLEVDAAGFGLGMKLAGQKLHELQEGTLDPDAYRAFWQPTAAERSKRREERSRRQDEEATNPAGPNPAGAKVADANRAGEKAIDPILGELKRWEKFVNDFVQAYKLNDGQRSAALSCLSELKQRAIAHRTNRRADIEKLEVQIQAFAGSEEDLAILKKHLTELYGPIDDMFKELQDRVEKLPTAEQRAAAEARAASQEARLEEPRAKAGEATPDESP